MPLPALLLSICSAGGFVQLHAEQATATSYLENNWNKFTENYHPNYVLDDDPKTAWVEGAEADGIGESIEIRTSPLASVKRLKLRIRNGYQKSKPLLRKNAAPKKMQVALLQRSGASTHEETITLTRKRGWQEFTIVVPEKQAGFAGVRLRIDAVHKGSVYRDTCISDVQIHVESKVPYVAKLEAAKHASLTAWIAERKRDAKYFANVPKTYPFSSTHFDRQIVSAVDDANEDETRKDFVPLMVAWKKGVLPMPLSTLFSKADLEQFKTLAAALSSKKAPGGVGPYKAVTKDVPKPPDGISLPNEGRVMRFLLADRVSFFESKVKTNDAMKSLTEMQRNFYTKLLVSNPMVEWTDTKPKRPARVHWWMHSIVEERGVYENRTQTLLVYEDGRVVRHFEIELGSSSIELVRADYTWANGKVTSVDVRRANGWIEFDAVGSNRYEHARYVPKTSLAKN